MNHSLKCLTAELKIWNLLYDLFISIAGFTSQMGKILTANILEYSFKEEEGRDSRSELLLTKFAENTKSVRCFI